MLTADTNCIFSDLFICEGHTNLWFRLRISKVLFWASAFLSTRQLVLASYCKYYAQRDLVIFKVAFWFLQLKRRFPNFHGMENSKILFCSLGSTTNSETTIPDFLQFLNQSDYFENNSKYSNQTCSKTVKRSKQFSKLSSFLTCYWVFQLDLIHWNNLNANWNKYCKVASTNASRFVTHLIYMHTQNDNFLIRSSSSL